MDQPKELQNPADDRVIAGRIKRATQKWTESLWPRTSARDSYDSYGRLSLSALCNRSPASTSLFPSRVFQCQSTQAVGFFAECLAFVWPPSSAWLGCPQSSLQVATWWFHLSRSPDSGPEIDLSSNTWT